MVPRPQNVRHLRLPIVAGGIALFCGFDCPDWRSYRFGQFRAPIRRLLLLLRSIPALAGGGRLGAPSFALLSGARALVEMGLRLHPVTAPTGRGALSALQRSDWRLVAAYCRPGWL